MTVTGAPLYGCLGRQIVTGSRLSGDGEPSCIAVCGPCGDLRRPGPVRRRLLPGGELAPPGRDRGQAVGAHAEKRFRAAAGQGLPGDPGRRAPARAAPGAVGGVGGRLGPTVGAADRRGGGGGSRLRPALATAPAFAEHAARGAVRVPPGVREDPAGVARPWPSCGTSAVARACRCRSPPRCRPRRCAPPAPRCTRTCSARCTPSCSGAPARPPWGRAGRGIGGSRWTARS